MSMDLENFWTIVLWTITSSSEFSICRGVAGCGWPIYSNILLIMTPYFALRYMAAILALDPEKITFQMMVQTTCTTILLIIVWPHFSLFVKKNYLPY